MKNVSLGSTGLQVSELCLGTMQFGWTTDEEHANAVMDAYVEAGGNFIDTADVYSSWAEGNPGGVSEEIIGRWMKARGNRDAIVLATKVRGRMWEGPDGEGLSRSHIMRAVEDSLRRLQVDTLDLYQCHFFDEKTPIEETLGAFEELVKSGKVRHIGASNFPLPRLAEALAVAEQNNLPRFEVLQPHHSLVHRKEFEEGLQQFCIEREMGVIPYSPLAGGFLTGKYVKDGERVQSQRVGGVKQYFTDDGWAALDAVRSVAAAHSTTAAAVSLAWQMAQPGVTAPIVGANTPEQLADQLPAIGLTLGSEDLAQLDKASKPFLG
ncbi:MAG: aldo/keto reductase [Tepidiformaceae bacterium]